MSDPEIDGRKYDDDSKICMFIFEDHANYIFASNLFAFLETDEENLDIFSNIDDIRLFTGQEIDVIDVDGGRETREIIYLGEQLFLIYLDNVIQCDQIRI